MKHLSLKLKLTLWYSFFMVLLASAAIAVLLSLSNREILAVTQTNLKENVQDSPEDLFYEDGHFDIDSDFYTLEDDVYLSLYDQDGNFLYGKIPHGFDQVPPFSDGTLQTIKDPQQTWYVFDLAYHLERYGPVCIRGITSATKAEQDFRITLRLTLIFFPLIIGLTILTGYRITRRALLPVQNLTETVLQIQKDADLSRRINLTGPPDHLQDEIQRLAATFDQMLEQLDRTFQREKQFTSDVSHELRTPVSVILAQCNACLEDESYTEKQREQISLIDHKARQISAIISQLLILSRADAGKDQLTREWINISELTEIAAEEQQLLAQEKGISITTDIEPDIIAFVDETFYIRLLMNLLSNAVSYGKENGFVHICLHRTTLHEKETWITCSISDNGCGISPEALPHIWERFYRTDSARTGSPKETHAGLGLSMARWIVEAHGGKIQAKSTLSQGSTFTFQLPG